MAVILELMDHEVVELALVLSFVLAEHGQQFPAARRKRLGAIAERIATYYPSIVTRAERRRKRGMGPRPWL